jgi:hypothetical protein
MCQPLGVMGIGLVGPHIERALGSPSIKAFLGSPRLRSFVLDDVALPVTYEQGPFDQ